MHTSTNRPDCGEALRDLNVAHSFADELATTNPQFDRVAFVRAATYGRTR